MSHVLVVANETMTGPSLIEAVKSRHPDLVTVLAPISNPHAGYVVYEDTRRAAAGRRLERTLTKLREAGIPAHGLVVDSDPADAVRDAIAMLEPRPTDIIVSTHPEEKSGWLRRKVIDRIRDAAGGLPVEHVVVDLKDNGGEANVLVIANETVVGDPLLDRIRERAARSPASFLIICPQSDPVECRAPRGRAAAEAGTRSAARRGDRRPRAGRTPGSVHGGDAGDPRRADRRGDRLDLRARAVALDEAEPRAATAQRLEAARRARRSRRGACLVAVHAEAHHGPPIANQSSRVDAPTLGMLLFIASEIMLFGSFFTIYFFARVVAGPAQWPPPPFHLPVFVAGINTAILVTSSFTMHWSLQAIKRGNRAGMQAGLVLTVALGLTFLLTQIREYSRIGFSPQDRRLRVDVLRPDGTARSARLRRPQHPHVHDDSRLPRPFHGRRATAGSRFPGSTGTSST